VKHLFKKSGIRSSFFGFVETLHILFKKEEAVDRRGFHPLPVPPPLRYSSAGLN
jgi:hypothetical protein